MCMLLYGLVKKMKNQEFLYFCLVLVTASAKGHENGRGVITVVVPEGRDAILPCSLSTKLSLQHEVFDWKKDGQKEVFLYSARDEYNNGRPGQDEQFKGRVSHFPEELKFGNASIVIRNTKLVDSGNYSCIFPHLQPKEQSFNIKLIVGAAPKPFVGILNITEDGALLKCEVPGAFPKPSVEWKNSDGNILPAEEPRVSYRGDRYYVTLLITVTKTDTNVFRCVATQQEISHVTDDEIYVPHCGKAAENCCGAGVVVAAFCGGVLITAVLFVVIKYIRRWQRGENNNGFHI
ncbi:V-set domain-containing T-cell activation inhibitor 1-like isoform X2 [Oreochromis niloticus]|uniref:V-set domain-containing T-cell activation inhibitor 1-like n=1 Tax=Oreochromis niloticus TaxID=8128 RepID=I3KF51_ORENI|nr:V-set domain-containing T-cell activation inhibitor 1-like isoform X2 [Oreochromis niloticus]